MESGHREVIRHSAIGGFVAVALAWFEKEAHHWFGDAFERHPNWFQALTLAAIFFGAFFTILIIQLIWERAPLKLPKIGTVDGIWIDILLISNKPAEIAIVEISSSSHGFEITGDVYEAASIVRGSAKHIANFSGAGHAAGDDLIYYHYRGHATSRTIRRDGNDEGVGFYKFSQVAGNHKELRYHGTFFGLNLKPPTRHVEGRKISIPEQREVLRSHAGKTRILNIYLSELAATQELAEKIRTN